MNLQWDGGPVGGDAKTEEQSFILSRYEGAHCLTGEVSLLTGVASQHTWTTLIRCCLQCSWQGWQTRLCASKKPERHNAEWKFGAVGAVGVRRLLTSCVWGEGEWSEPQVGSPRRPSGLETCFTLRGTLAPWIILQLRLLFFYLAHSVWIWVTKASFFFFFSFFKTLIVRSLVCTVLRALQLKNVKQLCNGYIFHLAVLYR